MKAKSLAEMATDLRRLSGAAATAELVAGAGADAGRVRAEAARLIAEALAEEIQQSLQSIDAAQRQGLHAMQAQQEDKLGRVVETIEQSLALLQQERQRVEARAAEAAVAAVERSLLPALDRLLARQQALRAAPAPVPVPPPPALSPLVMVLWATSVIVALVIGALIARPEGMVAVWQALMQVF